MTSCFQVCFNFAFNFNLRRYIEGLETPWVGTVPEWQHCERTVKSTRAAVTVAGRRRLLDSTPLELQIQEGAALRAAAVAGAAAGTAGVGQRQELTLVHFSAQPVSDPKYNVNPPS
jgi:hypothetical protein